MTKNKEDSGCPEKRSSEIEDTRNRKLYRKEVVDINKQYNTKGNNK